MYGQLKSTVTCQDCGNISITFDPFLTLSLPIAKPFKLEVYFVPYEMFVEDNGSMQKKEIKAFNIAVDKSNRVQDLKEKVYELIS